jgi:hypothetical protein
MRIYFEGFAFPCYCELPANGAGRSPRENYWCLHWIIGTPLPPQPKRVIIKLTTEEKLLAVKNGEARRLEKAKKRGEKKLEFDEVCDELGGWFWMDEE